MKQLFILSIAVLSCLRVSAQQDKLESRNVFNSTLMNPAYCGSSEFFKATLLYRGQWVGFEGAPQTTVLETHGPLNMEKMGIGLSISHDKIGVTRELDISAAYSYKIKIGDNKLSFGIRAGASNYSANLSQLVYWDENDVLYANDIQSHWVPKFGYGMYLQNAKYFAGISIPVLIAYDKDFKFSYDPEQSSYMRRHYYLNGGYTFDITPDKWRMRVAGVSRFVPSAPFQAEISNCMIYKDQFTCGLGFRTGDAVIAMVEYFTAQRIRISYSYDATVSQLRKYSNGTHEITVGWNFGLKAQPKASIE